MNYKGNVLKMGGLLAATLFFSLPATSASYAGGLPWGLPWGPPPPWGGGKPPVVHSAPGPVIGVGLPIIAAAGGFAWLRRRKREAASRFSKEA